MSWTYRFLREWLPFVDLRSALRLRNFVLAGENRPEDLAVHLRRWGDVHLRGLGGGDYRMFDCMFRRRLTPPIIPGCRTLVDIGGNIGLATIALARELPGLRSYVVEPDPCNFDVLRRNLDPLVRAGRCRIERAAMWKSNEMIEVEAPPLPGSFGAVRCVEANGRGASVQGMTMQAILDCSGFERVDLVKIDIEGAEAGMFAAGSDWLDRVGVVTIEFHGSARQDSDFDRVAKRHGLAIEEIHCDGVIASRPGYEMHLNPRVDAPDGERNGRFAERREASFTDRVC